MYTDFRTREQKEYDKWVKDVNRRASALAKIMKKAERVQYNTTTKTLTVFFNNRSGFVCRGGVAERVRALIACEEVEG